MAIELVDARHDSLTVTWPVTAGAKRYVLELKPAAAVANDENGGTAAADSAEEGFRELSSKLTQPQAKKKNLSPGEAYFFRVAPVVAAAAAETGDEVVVGSWTTHPEAFRTLSREEGDASPDAPTTVPGGNHALFVRWKAGEGATGYELQMRENKGGEGWTTLAASLSGTEVRKKNLTSPRGYQFRVRSSTGGRAFSPGVSDALRRKWFSGLRSPGTLLKSGSSAPVPLAEAVGGKEFVLFYVSASWCPPCRKFTPMLANWYRSHKHLAEVVFVSADHDVGQFQTYFASSHPWAAVDYDRDSAAREQIMSDLRVSGIPRLTVASASTGVVLVDNAVNASLDVRQWRQIAAGDGSARTAPAVGGGGGGCCGSTCDRFGNCS